MKETKKSLLDRLNRSRGTTPHSHPPPPPPVFEDMDGEETLLLETSRLSCAGTSFFVLDLSLTHENTNTTQHD